jgi:hypothetical protein
MQAGCRAKRAGSRQIHEQGDNTEDRPKKTYISQGGAGHIDKFALESGKKYWQAGIIGWLMSQDGRTHPGHVE